MSWRRFVGLIGVVTFLILLGLTLSGRNFSVNPSISTHQCFFAASSEISANLLPRISFNEPLHSYCDIKLVSDNPKGSGDETHKLPFAMKTSLSYTPHDPIVIANDSDLAAVAMSGEGTKTDPYIVEGLNITKWYSWRLYSRYYEIFCYS